MKRPGTHAVHRDIESRYQQWGGSRHFLGGFLGTEFLTHEQLIEKLHARGVSTDLRTQDVLRCEGYYPIVNGYKDPFIDKGWKSDAGEDRYLRGTTFDDIYRLFLFDRQLRMLLFPHLIEAETTLRAIIAHEYSRHYPNEPEAYLHAANYESGPGADRTVLGRLLHTLAELRNTTHPSRAEIIHYRNKHGVVPLWVLSNHLTFGNLSKLYALSKPSVKSKVCHQVELHYAATHNNAHGRFGTSRIGLTLGRLSVVRNVCAHDGRLYSLRVTKSERISDVFAYLKDVTPECHYLRLSDDFTGLIGAHMGGFSTVPITAVLHAMGIKDWPAWRMP